MVRLPAGPYLVKAAIGEDSNNKRLGCGIPTLKSQVSPIINSARTGAWITLRNDEHACKKPEAGFDRDQPIAPKKSPDELYGLFRQMENLWHRGSDRTHYGWFAVRTIQSRLWKNHRMRLRPGRWLAVGIVANQRKIVKSKKGEMQMGG